MALVTIPGGLWIPTPAALVANLNGGPFVGEPTLLDAAGEKHAFVLQAPRTGTLRTFQFRTSAVTINAASQVRCSFQDVLTTGGPPGAPDEVQDQFRNIAGSSLSANSWIIPGSLTTDGTDAGAKRSVTKGDYLACVIEFQAFTAGDAVEISRIAKPADLNLWLLPYQATKISGVWGESNAQGSLMALEYDDGVIEPIAPFVWPLSAATASVSLHSASNPRELGNILRFPAKVEVDAVWSQGEIYAGSGAIDVILYDSDGSTALRTFTPNKAASRRSGTGISLYALAPVTLKADTDYRLAIKGQGDILMGQTHDVWAITVPTQGHLNAVEGGQTWVRTQRPTDGAWTQTVTQRCMLGVRVAQIDDGVSMAGQSVRAVFPRPRRLPRGF